MVTEAKVIIRIKIIIINVFQVSPYFTMAFQPIK